MSLQEDTLFGHIDKVQIAIERLKTFEPQEGYYLAFSGGKDSICIYQLAKMSGVKFDAHYSNTTIDPPPLTKFIRKEYPQVEWNKPERPFLHALVDKGFPMGNKRWCCELYKENGGQNRLCITGIRAEESARRATRSMIEACRKPNMNKNFLHVIIDWTEKNVWEFIKGNGFSYPALYDQGWKRIGCLGCPMNTKAKEQLSQFPKFEKAFEKAFEKLKKTDRPGMKTWKNGKECFEWWINKEWQTQEKFDGGHCEMFGFGEVE